VPLIWSTKIVFYKLLLSADCQPRSIVLIEQTTFFKPWGIKDMIYTSVLVTTELKEIKKLKRFLNIFVFQNVLQTSTYI
jgi:hypothetical protein